MESPSAAPQGCVWLDRSTVGGGLAPAMGGAEASSSDTLRVRAYRADLEVKV